MFISEMNIGVGLVGGGGYFVLLNTAKVIKAGKFCLSEVFVLYTKQFRFTIKQNTICSSVADLPNYV